MLQLRSNCECCDGDLAPDGSGAFVCSFECTFCFECADALTCTCPNCGGELVARPSRPTQKLTLYLPSAERILRQRQCPRQVAAVMDASAFS